MNEKANDTKVFSNLIWRFGQVFGAQAVSFIVSIILARILDPAVYGTVALVTVFVSILQVFVDSGLGTALVQKKEADELDFSTVFHFNMFMCVVLYLLIFAAAPLIASYYEDPVLIPVVRTVSLILIVYGLKGVQQSYVARNFLFKRMFYATLAGNIGGAVLGIAMAVMGYGVWALVGQMLFNAILDTFILWVTVRWRPKAAFSLERLRSLFSYGWKILVTSLLETVYTNLCSLIIGKKYSDADLAYYHRGRQFPTLASYVFSSSMDSVLLPAMSKNQDDKSRVGDMTRRALQVSSYIMWPVAVGLAVCAEPMVRLLLTDKWLPCVPYMRIFCIVCAFQPIHTTSLNALKSLGRSDLFMKLEIFKKLLGLALIVVSMRWGIIAMALSELVTLFISHIVNSFPNRRHLSYGYFRQLADILPGMLLSLVMGAVVWCVQYLGLPDALTFLLQLATGVAVYAALSAIFRVESFMYLLAVLKKLLKRG